jgi:hypothetical protein
VPQADVQGEHDEQELERPVCPPAQAFGRAEPPADPDEDQVDQLDHGEHSQAGEGDEGELDHDVVHECDATEPVPAAPGG